jgi:hypothetical protein
MTSTNTTSDSIGAATMESDGTLKLQLRAEGPGGIVGDALLVYPPTHADYAMVKKHLEQNGGPMKPGDSRPVAPFPD